MSLSTAAVSLVKPVSVRNYNTFLSPMEKGKLNSRLNSVSGCSLLCDEAPVTAAYTATYSTRTGVLSQGYSCRNVKLTTELPNL